jgi:hypothetical protein
MIAFIGAVVLVIAGTAAPRSEACQTTPDTEFRSSAAAKDVMRWARAEATATDADSALTRMMTTGSVDAEGRSTGWMLELISAAGKRSHVVLFDKGEMNCLTNALPGPIMATPINESAATIVDLRRLVAIALDASDPKPDLKVLKVSASLQRNGDEAARWSIGFVDEKGYPKGQVTIDSITGAVVK